MDLEADISEFEKTFAMFSHLSSQMHDIQTKLAYNVIDVDEYTTPSQAPQTIWRPLKNLYLPIVVDYVVAVFPTTSTSVSLVFGPRVIPVANIAAGVFTADLRMQLEKDDDRYLQIAPAGVGFMEVMGHATSQVIDRP